MLSILTSPGTPIRNFFRDPGPRARQRRTGMGLLVTVLMLPVLLSVMGCFEVPAPVGDPEKSRIDPAMSGVWMESVVDQCAWMFVFEPYDKRTWLVRYLGLEKIAGDSDEDSELQDADTDSDDESESCLDLLLNSQLEVKGVHLIKAWRKQISGESFITFEFRGMLSQESAMDPYAWWVMKVNHIDEDHISLRFIDQDFEEINYEMTRSQMERVVRRNLNDAGLFFEGAVILERVPQSDYDLLAERFEDAGIAASYEFH